jgi:hypothetical protein
MPISENDIDLIDNYLKGNCTGAEKKQFEDRIKSDEAFNEEYLQLKSLSIAFEQLELKDELKQLESKIRLEKNKLRAVKFQRTHSENQFYGETSFKEKPINSNTKWISIAAGIAVIIGAAFIFNYSNETNSDSKELRYGAPLDSNRLEDSLRFENSYNRMFPNTKDAFNNSTKLETEEDTVSKE